MTISILKTKLYIPSVRPGTVSRPHLLERLTDGLRLGCRLTLLCAPAGYGKTTLVAEWIAGISSPSALPPAFSKPSPQIAWLALDESDNDPARFWTYFVAALQAVEPGMASHMPEIVPPPHLPSETALLPWINEIAAIPAFLVLVLDDFHFVTARPIHESLTFLLDHMPGNLHLVIITRADPPLPVARLRARGQLVELRQADLCFMPEEAAVFLNQMMRLDLTDEDVTALHARTEGWIAGLQIAALAAQAQARTSRRGQRQAQAGLSSFIQSFTGGNRYILDYLVEEVLYRQSPGVQAFLLHTAILDRLCGPLCDAVTGQGDEETSKQDQDSLSFANGQEILEYLERANLFVVPLDDHREWYRYHRLFADLLHSRLLQACPAHVPELHRRASAWYKQNGYLAEAIEHALSASDFTSAADLIEQVAEATMMRSEMATFLRWVDALPDDLVRVRPVLCVYHAWTLLFGGHPWAAVEARLAGAGQETGHVSGEVASLRAVIALLRGQMLHATELAHQALAHLPEENRFLRDIAAWSLAQSYFADGDAAAGQQALDELVRVGQETGNVMIAVVAMCHMAESQIAQGHLYKAQAAYEQALELATDGQGRQLPVAGLAMIGLGEVAREQNEFDVALRYLTRGIELAGEYGMMGKMDGYLSLARICQAHGDTNGAQAEMRQVQAIATRFDATELDDMTVAMMQAQLWIAQGNLEAAWRWARERNVEQDTAPSALGDVAAYIDVHLRKYEQLVLARLLLAEGRFSEALALLDRVQVKMEQRGRMGRVAEVQILKALAYHAQGDIAQALACLEQALTLVEPEGYVRLFVDEGEPIKKLLQVASSRSWSPTLTAYINKLLSAFQEPPPGAVPPVTQGTIAPAQASAAVPAQASAEALSKREMDVLRLLALPLSSAEIAQELMVSVNTVRSHIKSIYDKLSVHNRYEAIAQAQEMGLL